MTRQVTLSENGNPISTDYFVQAFIDHTVSGMIESLEGTGKLERLSLSIDGDKVTVNLNGANVSVNAFASKIIKSTVGGILAPLKGVKFPMEKVQLIIGH